jgi:phosphohistidine phosphatase
MELYLVQHGEAKPESEDPERPLTDRGTEAVRRIAAWAARIGVQVGQIRHSGKRRAEQTAALMGERLNPPKGVIVAEGLKPNDDPSPLAEALRSEHESLMVVGHLPYLGRLASLLVVDDPDGGIIRFQQAGIVCLDRQEGEVGRPVGAVAGTPRLIRGGEAGMRPTRSNGGGYRITLSTPSRVPGTRLEPPRTCRSSDMSGTPRVGSLSCSAGA